VIPSFRRGSGGHATIVHVLEGLRGRGHAVTVWLEDCEGRHTAETESTTVRSFREFFGTEEIVLRKGFADWDGADLVMATGWQTVARVLLLPGAGGRAYLVQDHEPDFYGSSAEALWARETYRQGLHCVAASSWLAALLRERYDASASHFDLAVDHDIYRVDVDDRRAGARERDVVVFYARALTARRAVPLGLLALTELHRRRPEVRIVLYGEDRPLEVPFPHRNAGLLDGAALAALYREATLGMVLSLTNPSLVALEMMACGLPCVELASESMLASFGSDGSLTLAGADPLALCTAIEALLDDPGRRERLRGAGTELMAGRTWERAASQVEHGLRAALGSAVRTAG
jgi:glycosyltransferase involved in cell wall biosynthesis